MPAIVYAPANDPRVRLALEAHKMEYLVNLHNEYSSKTEAVKKFSTAKAAASKIIAVLSIYPNKINLNALKEGEVYIIKEDTSMDSTPAPSNPLSAKLAAVAAATKNKISPSALAESAAAIAREAKEKSASASADKAAKKAEAQAATEAKKAEAQAAKAAKLSEGAADKAAKKAEADAAKAAKATERAAAKAAKAASAKPEPTPEELAEIEANKVKVAQLQESLIKDKTAIEQIQENMKNTAAELKVLAPKTKIKLGGTGKSLNFVRGTFAYDGTDIITVLVAENPKRNGAAVRFAVYSSGMTVSQALAGGVTRGDGTWDVGTGFISVVPALV